MDTSYLTPISHIQQICGELGIDFDKITNVYNYGSHVQGNNTPNSDYDLVIVGNFDQKLIEFKKDDPYYFDFENFKTKSLTIDNKEYDISVFSNTNFEKILENSFMTYIETLFSDIKFRPIEKINYKKYIDNLTESKIKKALKNEVDYVERMSSFHRKKKLVNGFDGKWLIKKMYTCLRYHILMSEFLKTGIFIGYTKEFIDLKKQLLDKEGEGVVEDVYNWFKVEITHLFN